MSVSAPRVAVALEDVRAAATPSGEFCVTCPIAAAEDVDEDEDEDEDEDGVLGGREGRRLEGVREDGRVDGQRTRAAASGCFLRGHM